MSFIRISVILVIALFAVKTASAQENDSIDTITVNSGSDDPGRRLLYAIVTKREAKIADSANSSIDASKIKGIYLLSDHKKFTEKFGDQGQEGVLLITFRKRYLKRYLNSIGIVYPSGDKNVYQSRPGSQIYQ